MTIQCFFSTSRQGRAGRAKEEQEDMEARRHSIAWQDQARQS
jgi:hypothetical protein